MLNAVNDAIRPLGARIDRLPLSAPNVLAALQARGAQVIAERFAYAAPRTAEEAVELLAGDRPDRGFSAAARGPSRR